MQEQQHPLHRPGVPGNYALAEEPARLGYFQRNDEIDSLRQTLPDLVSRAPINKDAREKLLRLQRVSNAYR